MRNLVKSSVILFCILLAQGPHIGQVAYSQILEESSGDSFLTLITKPWTSLDLNSGNAGGSSQETISILDTEKLQDPEYDNGYEYTGFRPWRAPQFEKNPEFNVPEEIRPIVQFWVDIYSKYSTNFGLLHDMDYPELVYDVIDFSDIEKSGHSAIRRELNRKRRVEARKKAVLSQLVKLSKKVKSGHQESYNKLTSFEKKVWDFFKKSKNLKEIKELGQKSRLRFQLGQADRMQTAIFYSGRYLQDIEKIFDEAGLPMELARIPFVESSFNVFAYSKVGASGIFQVMPNSSPQPFSTRRYYDMRNSPLAAAKMATKIFKMGKKLTGSWPLAVIGYNHGPSGVKKKVEKVKTREIGKLLSKYKKTFGFASRNFYPCFLAVLEVEGHADKYFKNIRWSERLPSVSYKLPISIKYDDLLSWYDNDHKKVKVYNPHLAPTVRRLKMTIPAGTEVEIPKVLSQEIIKDLNTQFEQSKVSARHSKELSKVKKIARQAD